MPIPLKDFVELMTDQRLSFNWTVGRWTLGQVLYTESRRGGKVVIKNTPYQSDH